MGQGLLSLDMHRSIKRMLLKRFDQRVMNNVHRSDYVECLVALALGPDCWAPWERGWDWAPWDCELESGARLEIKQSAARQSWDREARAPARAPRFDIAPRTGYWAQDGSLWVAGLGRPADIYLFAWHGERRKEHVDHRNTGQWRFFVVPERALPANQRRIGLAALRALTSPSSIDELRAGSRGCIGGYWRDQGHARRCCTRQIRVSVAGRCRVKTATGGMKADRAQESGHVSTGIFRSRRLRETARPIARASRFHQAHNG